MTRGGQGGSCKIDMTSKAEKMTDKHAGKRTNWVGRKMWRKKRWAEEGWVKGGRENRLEEKKVRKEKNADRRVRKKAIDERRR